MPEHEIIMLAHLLGDGSFVKRQPIRYASIDEENLPAVATAAEHFGITPVRDEHGRPDARPCVCQPRTGWLAVGVIRSPSGSTPLAYSVSGVMRSSCRSRSSPCRGSS